VAILKEGEAGVAVAQLAALSLEHGDRIAVQRYAARRSIFRGMPLANASAN